MSDPDPDPARIRTIRRVLIVVFAFLAVAQVVVGVLALAVVDGAESTRPLGVVMLLGAAVSVTLSILFAVALRRSR
ncbi:hypothetical protein ITJ42_08105 [Clavibacter michiganensis subsp. phaseoli]|uniref:Uncharacterized protein n=1 Tax=Clavibacter phaseoli TaxID=1734031 RepID=A0A8I0S940_9MICO|nr:hypothetical protein [Clavibacter phaseoli]MBF4631176.1 hypothetical protein [Clavibacter phaseoli]RII87202.1 hypothetical protein DZF95_16595 [Clavibacter michiganensis]